MQTVSPTASDSQSEACELTVRWDGLINREEIKGANRLWLAPMGDGLVSNSLVNYFALVEYQLEIDGIAVVLDSVEKEHIGVAFFKENLLA